MVGNSVQVLFALVPPPSQQSAEAQFEENGGLVPSSRLWTRESRENWICNIIICVWTAWESGLHFTYIGGETAETAWISDKRKPWEAAGMAHENYYRATDMQTPETRNYWLKNTIGS